MAACAAVLVSCTPKSQIDDLKKDVQSLKEADAALWAEMSAAIDKLEKDLMERIQATRDRLNKSIDAAVADLMTLMNDKMSASQNYLETELAAKKKSIDEHVDQVKANVDGAITAFDVSLEATKEFLKDAMDKNDKAQEDLMRQLESRIEDMVAAVDDASDRLDEWQARLDQMHDDGLFEAIANLEAETKKMKEFDIQGEVNAMESRIKRFSKITLDDLTEEQMKEVQSMLSDMESWYSDVEGMVSDSESMADEMEDLLGDWQGTADDLYDQLDSYTSDLSDRIAYFADFIESSYDEATDLEAQVLDWEGYLSSLNADLTDYMQRTDAMCDDWDGQHDDIESRADDLASLGDELIERCDNLMYDVDHYIDAHPWMFD